MLYIQDCNRISLTETSSISDQDEASLLSYIKGLRSTLPLFRLIDQGEDLAVLNPLAKKIQDRFSDVIILGTGGSSLGGQALCVLRENTKPRLHFHDNIDPHTFKKLFDTVDPVTTAVIAISKSGNTSETLMQLLVCLQHWSKAVGDSKIKDHFWIISEDTANGIREIAHTYHIPCLDHPQDIGGRFAAFTLVGLLPALISGLDATKIRKGARLVLDQVDQAEKSVHVAPLQGALISYTLMKKGYSQSVLLPYVDRLAVFSLWYRQLWAESLGKGGKGTTPIHSMGTVDQHSQLQLYLDGPKDKIFTVMTMNHGDQPFNLGNHPFCHPSLAIFQRKSMGQLLMAEQKATIDTLTNNQCPTRVIQLETLNEEVMGGLMMHYIIETLAMAYLLKVNPFDQPAVEESKVLTRAYLTEMS